MLIIEQAHLGGCGWVELDVARHDSIWVGASESLDVLNDHGQAVGAHFFTQLTGAKSAKVGFGAKKFSASSLGRRELLAMQPEPVAHPVEQ